jgi:hypothetical protein
LFEVLDMLRGGAESEDEVGSVRGGGGASAATRRKRYDKLVKLLSEKLEQVVGDADGEDIEVDEAVLEGFVKKLMTMKTKGIKDKGVNDRDKANSEPVQALKPVRVGSQQTFYERIRAKPNLPKEKGKEEVRLPRLLPGQWAGQSILTAAELVDALGSGQAPNGEVAVVRVETVPELKELYKVHEMTSPFTLLVLASEGTEALQGAGGKVWCATDRGVLLFHELSLGAGCRPKGNIAKVVEVKDADLPAEQEMHTVRVTMPKAYAGTGWESRAKAPARAVAAAFKTDGDMKTNGWRHETLQGDERVVGYVSASLDVINQLLSASGVAGIFVAKLGEQKGYVEWLAKEPGQSSAEYLAETTARAVSEGTALALRAGGGRAPIGLRREGARRNSRWVLHGVPESWGPGTVTEQLAKWKWTRLRGLSSPQSRGQSWWFSGDAPADDSAATEFVYRCSKYVLSIRPWFPAGPKIKEARVVSKAAPWIQPGAVGAAGVLDKKDQEVQMGDDGDDKGGKRSGDGEGGVALKKFKGISGVAAAVATSETPGLAGSMPSSSSLASAAASAVPGAASGAVALSESAAASASSGADAGLGDVVPVPSKVKGPDGVVLIDLGGRGDCGYRALAAGIAEANGGDGTVKKLKASSLDVLTKSVRARMLAQLAATRRTWEAGWKPSPWATTTTEAGKPATTVDEFLATVERPKRWACVRCLQAAAVAHRVNIRIFSFVDGKWVHEVVLSGGARKPKVVTLALHEQHFYLIEAASAKQAWSENPARCKVPVEWEGRGAGEGDLDLEALGAPLEEDSGGDEVESVEKTVGVEAVMADQSGMLQESALAWLARPCTSEAASSCGEVRRRIRRKASGAAFGYGGLSCKAAPSAEAVVVGVADRATNEDFFEAGDGFQCRCGWRPPRIGDERESLTPKQMDKLRASIRRKALQHWQRCQGEAFPRVQIEKKRVFPPFLRARRRAKAQEGFLSWSRSMPEVVIQGMCKVDLSVPIFGTMTRYTCARCGYDKTFTMLKRWPCKVWDGDRQAFNIAVFGKKGFQKRQEKLNADRRRRWAAKPAAQLSCEERCALKAQQRYTEWYAQLGVDEKAETCKPVFDDFVHKKSGKAYRCAVCDKFRSLTEVRKCQCRAADKK